MKPILLLSAAVVALSACTPYRSGSESVISSSDVGQMASVERCRVLEVREITIRDDDPTGSGTAVGAIAGGAVGAAIGSEVGEGVGNDLARTLGTLAGVAIGASLGERVDQDRGERPGLEYSVIDASGQEMVVVQEFLQGDRIAAPGSTCRIQTIARSGQTRILPAEQMPAAVNAPQRTRVNF